MQRIDGSTAAAALPAPAAVSGTPGFFTGGDPAVPTAPTIVTPDWLNMVQEELVAVIIAAGVALDKANTHQLRDSIQSLIASGAVTYASDAETTAGAITNKVVSPHGAAALVTARINALVNGAPAALDTLKELADAIADDASYAATITTALALRVAQTRVIGTSGLLTGGNNLSADLALTVAIATAAQIATGTANDRAITPAGLAGVGGTNGYGSWTVLPGGFLEQWGSITVNASGGSSAAGLITFPQGFATSCQSITGNADDGPSPGWRPMTCTFPGGPGLASCAVQIDSTDQGHTITAGRTVWWRAIGR